MRVNFKSGLLFVMFLLPVFCVTAQNAEKRHFVLYDQPYNYSFGLKYGHSVHSPAYLGAEFNCRWFGVGVEVDRFSRWRDNDCISVPFTVIDVLQLQSFSLEAHALFRYFSVGCAWGMSTYLFTIIETSALNGEGNEKEFFVRPYVSGYVPMLNNRILLNATMGYDLGMENSGLYFGIGISKTLL